MVNNLYIKYYIPYKKIDEIISIGKYKTISFFIDLQSVARGLFNKKTIEIEIADFTEERKIYKLIKELDDFVNNLREKYKKYEPFFVIFYDNGKNEIHKSILKTYKSNRTYSFEDSVYEQIYKKIKLYYFQEIYKLFNSYEYSSCVYLDRYETDFIPHYLISENILGFKDYDNLNIILSTDKDLLQTTEFENTFQSVVSYRKRNFNISLYNKNDCISYIYPKFKPGYLTAKYIPLILSIAGDSSDDIPGIKGFGYAKTIKLIEKKKLSHDLSNIEYSGFSNDEIKIIKRNYKLTSFDEYIRLIPRETKKQINELF